ncbi:energy-coupling factor transporter transmembrane component T family protein [Acidianus manzaensis]|uniref:Cobalt transporter n=1 Tax=Acidianus manzaensis TaxID=282676 RepID=A0A1W6K2P5_9CREN|nr:energy-coupling factor transporter transmembrane component T [Acidianus manzaensis]ARM76796.1 hypothetical protein B6F84_12725 [Acidianus manzaensis]
MNLVDVVISWFFVIFGASFPLYLLLVAIGIKGFEQLTHYVEKNTIMHKVNPLTKLIILLLITIVASQSIWWIGFMLGLIGLIFFIPLQRVRLIILFSVTQIFGMTWGFSVFTPPSLLLEIFHKLNVIWTFPSYFQIMGYVPDLTIQALIYGFQVSMRVWGMFIFSMLVLLTTTTSQMINALSKFKVPLGITFAVTIAMISIPRIFETADTAYKIQVMRGEKKIIALFQSIVPTTIFLFKNAKITGISAETRCFMESNSRTELDEIKLSEVDKIIISLAIILTIVDLYFVAIGLIPAIPLHG